MKNSNYILILFLMLCFWSRGQRPHLEVGGTIGFKDELFLRPSFDHSLSYFELHLYEATVFMRISKLKYGAHVGIGFEKAGNYFSRSVNASTRVEYVNLNRLSIELNPYFYIVKNAKFKWDIGLGGKSYFNANSFFFIPDKHDLRIWKMGGRLSTNITYKSFMVGVFYERDLRSDYQFDAANAVFGIRAGLIY